MDEISRHVSSPAVTVLVRPGEKKLYAHASLLNRSPFFRAALQKGCFMEGKEQVVKLPEDNVLPFKCFFGWLYQGEHADTGRVFADVSEDEPSDGNDMATSPKPSDDDDMAASPKPKAVARIYDFGLQFQCYILGDKLQVKGFKDHMWREISEDLSNREQELTVDQVRYVYDNTLGTDRLRKFCIDMFLSSRTALQLLRDGTIQNIFSGKSSSGLQADFKEKLILRMDMAEKEMNDMRKQFYDDPIRTECLNCLSWRVLS